MLDEPGWRVLQGTANTTNQIDLVMTGSRQERLYTQAKDYFEAKDYSQAIVALRELLHNHEYKIKALANIGACLYRLQHYHAAIKYLKKAIVIAPEFLPARFNLANALFALGSYQEASQLYGLIVERDPTNNLAWQGHFDSLLALGQTEACGIAVENWQKKLPDSSKPLFAQARLLRRLDMKQEAVKTLNKILVSDPNNSNCYALISEILLDLKRMDDALAYINKAIQLEATEVSHYCTKANIHYIMSQVTHCADAYARALEICPSSATLLLNQYLLFPIIPSTSAEIKHYRRCFLEGLSLAESSQQLALIPQHPIAMHTFPLAYHNQNDRSLLERYMKLMKRLADSLLRHLAVSTKTIQAGCKKSESGKIRIGFLSRFFYGHSNTIAFEGLIRNLNREKFIIVLIHVFGSLSDLVQARLNSCCDEVVTLSDNIHEIYHTLSSLELDILYFTDMGMTPYDFLMPMLRTCRVQVTGWGIPHTSGNHDIDYYISAEDLEPADADEHYTETLVRLPGGLPCCFITEDDEVPTFPREYFFLPSHCQLIGCLQSLHKIHPDFDLIMEEIANQNPDVIFVFVEDVISHSTDLFLQRLSDHASSVREQSLFLNVMGRGEYQALCRCMDLLLDPIYYGSGITFFEAARVGTPIITLEGSYLRSRMVCSGYREMGINAAPIAQTPFEYVRMASDLLRDHHKRDMLKSEILKKNHILFNRMDFVRHFEEFCCQVADKEPY